MPTFYNNNSVINNLTGGTVLATSVFSTSLSATNIYSGTSNLNQVFQPIAYNFIDTTDSAFLLSSTTNTILRTAFIPAGSIKTNSVLNVNTTLNKTGVTGTVTLRLYVSSGSTVTLDGATQLAIYTTTASNVSVNMERTFYIKNATGSTQSFPSTQKAITDLGFAGTPTRTLLPINWTTDRNIILAAQQSLSADTAQITTFIVKQL